VRIAPKELSGRDEIVRTVTAKVAVIARLTEVSDTMISLDFFGPKLYKPLFDTFEE